MAQGHGPRAEPTPAPRRGGFLVLLAALAGATVAGGAALALAGDGGRDSLPTVVLTARHSKFVPARVVVEAGTTVRFVVRNADPIAHELIVGPKQVHDRHETGTEAWHPPRPGEVSVRAYDEADTTYTFTDAGVVTFGCHLPGHWDYGMQGEVEVR